jgi:hypothetical protein
LVHCGVLCLILLIGLPACYGGEFHNALSLQGFTGLLNTPNAEVTDEGKAYILFSNQKESQWRDRVSREESYIFSVGLFSFAEIGGRLTEAPGAVRDLSANAKVKLPFSSIRYFLPDIAFGMQDMGGGAKNLQTKYVVATEELWRLRFSLGYGAGPDRMDGVFGGIEFKTFDWLYLIGEHDTKETNIGIRLVTPEMFGLPVNLQATAKTSLDYRSGNMEFGIGLQFPLGARYYKNRTHQAEEDGARPPQPETEREAASPLPAAGGEKSFGQDDSDGGLQRLREKLVAGGFLNVRVGADAEKALLVIEYENSRYNHNELDALGVVAGLAVDTVTTDFEIIQLIIRKKGIRLLQVSAALSDFRKFLHDTGKSAQLYGSLEITPEVVIDKAVRFIDGDANSSLLKSELVVYPGLKTYVGTEVGVFDYLLSVKPDYYLNLWKGAVVNARFDIPVSWSQNFNDGKVFRNSRESSQADRFMLFQAIKATPRVMLNLGAGMILHDTYGTVNELMWTPGDGNHRFLLKQVYTSSSDPQALYQSNRAYLGSYRYYFGPLDLHLEGTAGQFLDNDRGFSIELKRFFGDTAFSLFYKNSWTEAKTNVDREHVQMGGVQISIPLTPRRDMKPSIVQVKGSNEWSYVQETKIVTPGNANNVNTSIGMDPQMGYNLERVYYNRDRLSEEYIRMHLPRLRDAYLTYRLD